MSENTPVQIQIEDLTEQIKNLSERENQHYTDIMLLLQTIEKKIEDGLLQVESGLTADELYEVAKAAVIEAGKASTSYLQRKLGIGYARAASLIDMLEDNGVISEGDGAKPREVIITEESGE